MLAGRPSAVVLTLALAATLTLTGIAAAATISRPGPQYAAASSLPTQVRRAVIWYGVPVSAPRTLHIESSSVKAPSPDEFQITYADGNFTLVYQQTAGGPITNRYTLSVQGLVEWNDTHGDGNFEEGSVVAYTPLGPGAFGRYPIQHTNRTTADGIGVNSFLITSNKGDLRVNLTIADGFVALPSGQILTPMEAKMSLEVYHNMTLPGTRLALQISMSTDQKVSFWNQSWDDMNEFSTEDNAVNVTSDAGPSSSSSFFAWSKSASVNGQAGAVTPSGPLDNATPDQHDLYLSYPRPAVGGLQVHIVHDPAMGVVSAAYLSTLHPGPGSPLPFQGDALLYGVSLAGISALVAGTALLVSRRRRKAL